MIAGSMLPKPLRLPPRQLITSLILSMAIMPAYPLPSDGVGGGGFYVFAPEVGVFDFFEVAFDPCREPFVDRFDDVAAVADDGDVAGLFEELESLDDPAQLHAVVGGVGLTAGVFASLTPVVEDAAVTAGSWVAETRAVGVESDLLFGHGGSLVVLGRLYRISL